MTSAFIYLLFLSSTFQELESSSKLGNFVLWFQSCVVSGKCHLSTREHITFLQNVQHVLDFDGLTGADRKHTQGKVIRQSIQVSRASGQQMCLPFHCHPSHHMGLHNQAALFISFIERKQPQENQRGMDGNRAMSLACFKRTLRWTTSSSFGRQSLLYSSIGSGAAYHDLD
ncbi:hypothetical protein EVAR_36875_1 [Eumeta japonica]|uniref:Secreted protein n=1 Tax=Eumeta variegata TaxID=151549 RepID=A0A4C1WTS1_EUMVA|nr:hypothetical protein EVAR_36875_1 [Eumeta japonica]